MSRTEICALLGRLTGVLGAVLLVPLGVALAYGESAWLSFAAPAALGLAIGWLSRRIPLEAGGRRAPASGGSRMYLFVALAWGPLRRFRRLALHRASSAPASS